MRSLTACLAFLCAASLRADSFADLKGAVAALRGTSPIHATVELQQVEVDRSKKPPEAVSGGAVGGAPVHADGLPVVFPPALPAPGAGGPGLPPAHGHR